MRLTSSSVVVGYKHRKTYLCLSEAYVVEYKEMQSMLSSLVAPNVVRQPRCFNPKAKARSLTRLHFGSELQNDDYLNFSESYLCYHTGCFGYETKRAKDFGN